MIDTTTTDRTTTTTTNRTTTSTGSQANGRSGAGPCVVFGREGRVVTARINRPKALNALNADVMELLVAHLESLDDDPTVGCFLILGSERAFAAGADIKELSEQTYTSMTRDQYFSRWDDFAALRTPKVAAVSGYALGGGCELAMMCDIVLASTTACFGQPEVKLGLMPGMGGTQRLSRLIGRAKAMDMILTGRMMNAEEAERSGLVARVVATEALTEEAMETARTIASFSSHTITVARDAVARADELPLTQGVGCERRDYFALFDTADAVEGMSAFIEKRDPSFNRSTG